MNLNYAYIFLGYFNLTVVVDILQHRNFIKDKNILVAYKGGVNGDFFVHILHMVENKLQKIEPSVKLRKKIFNILVEILQNIYHYFEESETEEKDAAVVFFLYKDNEDYCIYTGNQIKKENVIALKLMLDRINALDKEQLKKLYREKLIKSDAVNGRAGLGIIDIKRKAGAKIDYQFKSLDDKHSFFNLIVRVNA